MISLPPSTQLHPNTPSLATTNTLKLSRSTAVHYNPQDDLLWQSISKRISKPLPNLFIPSSNRFQRSPKGHKSVESQPGVTVTVPSSSASAPQTSSTRHQMQIPRVIVSSSSEDAITTTYLDMDGDSLDSCNHSSLEEDEIGPPVPSKLLPPPTSIKHAFLKPQSRHFPTNPKKSNRSTTTNRYTKPLPTLPPTSIIALINLMEAMESEMIQEVQRVQESIRELKRELCEYRIERRRERRERHEEGRKLVTEGLWSEGDS